MTKPHLVDLKPGIREPETGQPEAKPEVIKPDKRSLLQRLRIDPHVTKVGLQKKLTNVKIRKPTKFEWVRVNPEMASTVAIIDHKDEGEIYVVEHDMIPDLKKWITIAEFRVAINKAGVVFIWPIKHPSADGKDNSWNSSARVIAKRAETDWVNCIANKPSQSYEMTVADDGESDEEPGWPIETEDEIFEVAIEHFLIKDASHPLAKSLLRKTRKASAEKLDSSKTN